jgi:hypothetical protein
LAAMDQGKFHAWLAVLSRRRSQLGCCTCAIRWRDCVGGRNTPWTQHSRQVSLFCPSPIVDWYWWMNQSQNSRSIFFYFHSLRNGNRYCINLVSVAGFPKGSANDGEEEGTRR